MRRVVVILMRWGLIAWGLLLMGSSLLELASPNAVRSEPTTRWEVFPSVLCAGTIGLFLILPARMLSSPARRYAWMGFTLLAIVAFRLVEPEPRPPLPQTVLVLTLFYALPSLARWVLALREARTYGQEHE